MKLSHVDVIVVGSGGAGVMAAIAAADEGAKVLQFEKQSAIGGIFATRGGTTSGAQTRMQFEAGIDDNPYKFYNDCMGDPKARKWCDPGILMYYCQRAGQEVDYLDSLGAYPPEQRRPFPGIYGENWPTLRCYFPRRDFPALLFAEHEKRIQRGDIEIQFNTAVTDIIEEAGKVVGVRAREDGGTARDYRAGAVIICTGGFGANIELIRKHNLTQANDIMTLSPTFCTGDGLLMCDKIGVQMVNLGHTVPTGPYLGGVPDVDNPGEQIAHVNLTKYPGAIWVDLNGKRLANENGGYLVPPPKNAVAIAPGQTMIVILDQKIMEENESILVPWMGTEPPARSWEWFKEQAAAERVITRADSIEGLASSVGIDPRALKDTVTRYNGYVTAGEDEDFGRPDLDYKLENPPFYAIRTGVLVIASCGGPRNNIRQQVLDRNDKVIPGLYVAGEASGYQGFATGMYTMGNLVFGKQAGRMAAGEALGSRF